MSIYGATVRSKHDSQGVFLCLPGRDMQEGSCSSVPQSCCAHNSLSMPHALHALKLLRGLYLAHIPARLPTCWWRLGRVVLRVSCSTAHSLPPRCLDLVAPGLGGMLGFTPRASGQQLLLLVQGLRQHVQVDSLAIEERVGLGHLRQSACREAWRKSVAHTRIGLSTASASAGTQHRTGWWLYACSHTTNFLAGAHQR